MTKQGRVVKQDISEFSKENMLEFFLSLMYSRAIADVRDGLKPVHQRLIYGSKKMGVTSNKPYRKSASVVGNVLGSFHPHGDASLYETAVRMTQDFSLNLPMLDGYGNMGNAITGDSAAHQRYTEMRLAKYSEECLLDDIDKNAVDMVPTFDNMTMEPTVLPAKTLNLLINGSMGIGGGYAQHVPLHNVNEVCDMIIKVIENPDISIDEIAQGLAPDYPTGGYLCSHQDIIDGYKTGRGNVRLRANATIEGNKIIVTDMPYGISVSNNVNKKGLVSSISDAVKKEQIEGITTLHDFSDKNGVRLEINIKKGHDPEIVLNQLYKYTLLEYTVKIILVCKNGNSFKEYNIKEIFTEWLDFRRNTIKRIFIYDIKKYKLEMHELEGIVIALNDIDKVIQIIKTSPNEATTYKLLTDKYNLTDIQIKKILAIRLTQLHKMEQDKLLARIKDLKEIINDLTYKLSHPDIIDEIIIEEQREIKKKYGQPRRTAIREVDNLDETDLINDEDVHIIIGRDATIKRTSLNIKTQRRNTKGRMGKNIKSIHQCNLRDNILFFTNQGRVYQTRVYDIKEVGSLNANGINISSYIDLRADEEVNTMFFLSPDIPIDQDKGLIFATKQGYVKLSKLDLYKNLGKSGLIAIDLKDKDEVLKVKTLNLKEDISVILTSTNGNVIRFNTDELTPQSRNTQGSKSIKLEDGHELLDMDLIDNLQEDKLYLLLATAEGLGKRVKVKDLNERKNTKGKLQTFNDGFPIQKRSSTAKGRLGLNLNSTDKLVGSKLVTETDEIYLVSTSKVLSIKVLDIPITKRPAYGSKLIDLEEGDLIKNITKK